MIIYELLAINKDLLKRLHEEGIKTSDYKLVELFEEYEWLRKQGEKVTYIITKLSVKYNICERSIYSIIRRLTRDCIIGTSGMCLSA
jgi:hypothetical protein